MLSNLWKDKLTVLLHSQIFIENERLWHSGNFARGRLGNASMRMRAALGLTLMFERGAAEGQAGGQDQESYKVMEQQIQTLLSPWFRYFAAYDPRPTLSEVTCPVLALIGQKDVQVNPSQNLPAIRSALTLGGNSDFLVKELPDLNHLFQPCKTGMPDEYQSIEVTMAPKALKIIGDFVTTRLAD